MKTRAEELQEAIKAKQKALGDTRSRLGEASAHLARRLTRAPDDLWTPADTDLHQRVNDLKRKEQDLLTDLESLNERLADETTLSLFSQ